MGMLLKRYLSVRNYYPARITDKNEILALMKSLYPLKTEYPLIRLGPVGDGGYLVPDDLTGIEACYSPGVSAVSGFEKDCAKRGMEVFLADRSVEGPAECDEKFHFEKKFLGATVDQDFMTIDDWVNTHSTGERDLLLQMDIEGYEYEVFLSMSDHLLKRFRIMVVEFHTLNHLWNKPYFAILSRVFKKILQNHDCVHIHPNNVCGQETSEGLKIPQMMEMTFLRRDRVKKSNFATVFPHPLDADNVDKKTLVLPPCWFSEL